MTTRNVDLLIRARDGASRAFREVSKALDELGAIQEQVAAGGERLDQSLTESKGAATALSRTIGSQTAREAQKAETVFQRIEQTIAAVTAQFDKQAAEIREAEAATPRWKRRPGPRRAPSNRRPSGFRARARRATGAGWKPSSRRARN